MPRKYNDTVSEEINNKYTQSIFSKHKIYEHKQGLKSLDGNYQYKTWVWEGNVFIEDKEKVHICSGNFCRDKPVGTE